MAIDLRSIFLSTCLILPLLGSLDILTTTWRMHNLNCRLHSTLHSYRVSVCEYPVWKYRVFIWYGYEFWEYCRCGQGYSAFWVEKICFHRVDIGPDEHPVHYNAIVSYVSPTTNFIANIAVTMHPPHFASSTPVHSLSLRFPFFSTIVSNCA